MTENQPDPEVAIVSCPCGASVEADLGGRRPVVVCPECKESLKVVVTLDPRTGKKRVGILVSPMAVVPEKPRKAVKGAPAAAVGEGMFKPLCTCGSEVIVDFRSVDSVFTCGWCGASFTAFLKTDKESGEKVPVLIPVQVMPMAKERAKSSRKLPKVAEPPKAKTSRKGAAPLEELEELEAPPVETAKTRTTRREAAAPEPRAEASGMPKPKTVRRGPEEKKPAAEQGKSRMGLKPPVSVPGRESLFLTAKGEIGAQEAVMGEEGARIYCFCGKEIVLVGDATNRLLRCVECGLSFRVFLAVEPRTKKPMAVTLPRAPAAGKKGD
jgi:hypothetical protein